MTLLIALACDSFVMQVSDRRLSRNGKAIPGEWNKAVIWCNLASIAYTGNAFLDRRETKKVEDWIADTVGGASSVHDLLGSLIHDTEAWLKRSRTVHRQAFSIVGWEPQADGSHVPYAALISNFHDEFGNLRKVTREFNWTKRTRTIHPARATFFVGRAGETVTKEEFRTTFRGIKRILRKDGDPARAADILTQIIRMVAMRTGDTTVGRDVMVTCLPRPSQNAAFFGTSRTGRPSLDAPSFYYRSSDGDNSVAFGPKVVCAHVVQSIEGISFLNESGSDVDMLMSVRLLPSHPIYQQQQREKRTP